MARYPDLITGNIITLENVKGTLKPTTDEPEGFSFYGRIAKVSHDFKRTASGDIADATHYICTAPRTAIPNGTTLISNGKYYKLLDGMWGQYGAKIWIALV